jgi:DNA invertase Pin-like site-specific DNA recombinase
MFMFAEFERGIIREHIMAGLSPAKADGIQFGRRRLEDSDADKVAAIVAARAMGALPAISGWAWTRSCG